MALDKNLFTLNLESSKIEPGALDLVDPSGTVHYRKRVVPNEAGTYLISLSEPLSESLLATAAAPAATSKEKVIELHNPSVIVPLTYKGTLTTKWGFTWEENDFEWRREACHMIRKPDPPVQVAVTKELANKTTTVQILDYNLNRFDIEDRKGLEIVLLTSLLTFGDLEQTRIKSNEAIAALPNAPATRAAPPPLPPPKPEGWKDQIAVLQAQEQRTVNEVVIGEQGDVDDYVQHCVSLLNDDSLLFITLRSLTPSCVGKVVQVAEATKRQRYKDGGYNDDEDLHQYVDTFSEEKSKAKGPRVINLDDKPTSNRVSYQPPNTLTIHLSKIAMPELEPKTNKPKPGMSSGGPPPQSSSNELSGRLSGMTLGLPLGSRPLSSASPTSASSHTKARSGRSPRPSNQPLPPPQQQPRPPAYNLSQPTRSTQQPRSKLPSDTQNHPRGSGPPLKPQFRPPQQIPISSPRPGHATSYPGPGPLNASLMNPVNEKPPLQRASGKGFFSKR